MGMDGLSMSNTGIRKEATSLDYSKESEETAKEDTEKSMIVQELTEQERVNEEREENKKRRKSKKGKSEDDDEESEDDLGDEDEEEDSDDVDAEVSPDNLLLIDGENKGFYTKLSKNLENIELYDRITDRLIGTITPEELSFLITKLNMGTGIFINKKV
jgi:hypothetical protein